MTKAKTANDSASKPPYRVVIGLEVHVQLRTKSKLFCGCSTEFGAPANTQTCPVCLGLPGALPVLNSQAIELAMTAALALNCNIPELTKWDRKNYFYPDLPKGYQISQFDLPISEHGYLAISDSKDRFQPKRVGITRAHLEEDAGKSMHDESHGSSDTCIDLNRTGTPLLEIVSEPDMSSSAEAKAYLTELRLLLTYLDVSDCNMQEGSLRVDANVNLHIDQDGRTIATPIVEVKNMNSFRAVERALDYEVERQYAAWQRDGLELGQTPKVTRGWDDGKQETYEQRSKEESSDYRYFPDPDLIPLTISRSEVERVQAAIGERPAELRERLEKTYEIPAYDADVIVNQGRPVVNYFEAVAQDSGDGKRSSNWIQQDVLRTLNEHQLTIEQFPISSQNLAALIKEIQAGKLDSTRAKDVFQVMFDDKLELKAAKDKLGIVAVDANELDELCESLLDANPAVIADVKAGKQQAVGALIGQAKQKNPNVNPGLVRSRLLELIAKRD